MDIKRKSAEDWVRKYLTVALYKGKMFKGINNHGLFKDFMDAYSDYIHDDDHDWNEDIYYLNIMDVVRYHIGENSAKDSRLKRYIKNKLFYSRNSPLRTIYLDRHIKQFVKRSVSSENKERFDRIYGNAISRVYI